MTAKTAHRVRCFSCLTSEDETRIIRFGLRMQVNRDGKPVSKMAGGIHLCERCWQVATSLRTRRGDRRKRTVFPSISTDTRARKSKPLPEGSASTS